MLTKPCFCCCWFRNLYFSCCFQFSKPALSVKIRVLLTVAWKTLLTIILQLQHIALGGPISVQETADGWGGETDIA